MRGAVQGGYSDQRKLVCLVVNSQSKGLVELEIWCIDILSSFLSFLPPLSPYIPLLLVSFIPSNIHHSSLPPSHGSLYPCSDKDLLSQTRTLAMSFVKCASTDTEHQYKLVKDISFWQTPTCRLTVTPNWRYKLTVFFFFFFCTKDSGLWFRRFDSKQEVDWLTRCVFVVVSVWFTGYWYWIQSFLDRPF